MSLLSSPLRERSESFINTELYSSQEELEHLNKENKPFQKHKTPFINETTSYFENKNNQSPEKDIKPITNFWKVKKYSLLEGYESTNYSYEKTSEYSNDNRYKEDIYSKECIESFFCEIKKLIVSTKFYEAYKFIEQNSPKRNKNSFFQIKLSILKLALLESIAGNNEREYLNIIQILSNLMSTKNEASNKYDTLKKMLHFPFLFLSSFYRTTILHYCKKSLIILLDYEKKLLENAQEGFKERLVQHLHETGLNAQKSMDQDFYEYDYEKISNLPNDEEEKLVAQNNFYLANLEVELSYILLKFIQSSICKNNFSYFIKKEYPSICFYEVVNPNSYKEIIKEFNKINSLEILNITQRAQKLMEQELKKSEEKDNSGTNTKFKPIQQLQKESRTGNREQSSQKILKIAKIPKPFNSTENSENNMNQTNQMNNKGQDSNNNCIRILNTININSISAILSNNNTPNKCFNDCLSDSFINTNNVNYNNNYHNENNNNNNSNNKSSKNNHNSLLNDMSQDYKKLSQLKSPEIKFNNNSLINLIEHFQESELESMNKMENRGDNTDYYDSDFNNKEQFGNFWSNLRNLSNLGNLGNGDKQSLEQQLDSDSNLTFYGHFYSENEDKADKAKSKNLNTNKNDFMSNTNNIMWNCPNTSQSDQENNLDDFCFNYNDSSEYNHHNNNNIMYPQISIENIKVPEQSDQTAEIDYFKETMEALEELNCFNIIEDGNNSNYVKASQNSINSSNSINGINGINCLNNDFKHEETHETPLKEIHIDFSLEYAKCNNSLLLPKNNTEKICFDEISNNSNNINNSNIMQTPQVKVSNESNLNNINNFNLIIEAMENNTSVTVEKNFLNSSYINSHAYNNNNNNDFEHNNNNNSNYDNYNNNNINKNNNKSDLPELPLKKDIPYWKKTHKENINYSTNAFSSFLRNKRKMNRKTSLTPSQKIQHSQNSKKIQHDHNNQDNQMKEKHISSLLTHSEQKQKKNSSNKKNNSNKQELSLREDSSIYIHKSKQKGKVLFEVISPTTNIKEKVQKQKKIKTVQNQPKMIDKFKEFNCQPKNNQFFSITKTGTTSYKPYKRPQSMNLINNNSNFSELKDEVVNKLSRLKNNLQLPENPNNILTIKKNFKLSSLKFFNFKFLKRENVDKKVLRKFRNFLEKRFIGLDHANQAINLEYLDSIIEDGFIKDFLKKKIYPPYEDEKGNIYKSFSTSFMIWFFSHSKIVSYYQEFIGLNLEIIIDYLVQSFHIKNAEEIKLLKGYLIELGNTYSNYKKNNVRKNKLIRVKKNNQGLNNMKNTDNMNNFNHEISIKVKITSNSSGNTQKQTLTKTNKKEDPQTIIFHKETPPRHCFIVYYNPKEFDAANARKAKINQ